MTLFFGSIFANLLFVLTASRLIMKIITKIIENIIIKEEKPIFLYEWLKVLTKKYGFQSKSVIKIITIEGINVTYKISSQN